MASIEKFNDHCWKDVVPASDLELYKGWRRETFVGPRPALLAIDLYDLVYRGGPLPPAEINERYPNTVRDLRASGDRADQAAVRRRAPRRHPDFLLHPGDAPQQPPARRGVDQRARGRRPADDALKSIMSFRSSRTTS